MKNIVKIILAFILGIILSVSISVYASVLINSKDVVYDNSVTNLSANVQDAIDETYSKAISIQQEISSLKTSVSTANTKIKELEDSILTLDKIYPVGSVYITTTEDTVVKVQEKFGGTWERYSEGRTLVGTGTGTDSNGSAVTFNNNATGGEYSHLLTIAEMPSHTHSLLVVKDVVYGSGGYFPKANDVNGQNEGLNSSPDNNKPIQTTGESQYHNNIQPYTVVYMYKRTK